MPEASQRRSRRAFGVAAGERFAFGTEISEFMNKEEPVVNELEAAP